MKRLTENQKEILREVRKGKEYSEIARDREVAYETIRNTMKLIMKNLDAKNRMEAIRHAERCGELEKE